MDYAEALDKAEALVKASKSDKAYHPPQAYISRQRNRILAIWKLVRMDNDKGRKRWLKCTLTAFKRRSAVVIYTAGLGSALQHGVFTYPDVLTREQSPSEQKLRKLPRR